MKNSFVNILEVNRQCLHSLSTRLEDDFEKVSSTTLYGSGHCFSILLSSGHLKSDSMATSGSCSWSKGFDATVESARAFVTPSLRKIHYFRPLLLTCPEQCVGGWCERIIAMRW